MTDCVCSYGTTTLNGPHAVHVNTTVHPQAESGYLHCCLQVTVEEKLYHPVRYNIPHAPYFSTRGKGLSSLE